jgi:REP element-mobilizing transposase RayT
MSAPVGYFITWTVAGTWLHGDRRGSVNRVHNLVGRPKLPVNPSNVDEERAAFGQPPIELSTAMREVVEQTVRAHCAFRHWAVLSLNVRTNHVHLVVRAEASPEVVMGQCKAWASRRLREAGLVSSDQKLWTRHGSTRWINRHEDLAAAIDYVVRLQDHPGRFSHEA